VTFTIDANTLLIAADADSPLASRAREALQRATTGDDILYVFWPVLMAYARIATHPRILPRPLPIEAVAADIDFLVSHPRVRTGSEGPGFWNHYREVTRGLPVRGNLVPDAHIVALMRQHDVRTIWTHDRGFRRFDGIRVVDPLTGDA
jgi:toxin-antitoxin system PIN domain toxin